MSREISGVYPAIPTPFTADSLEIDHQALREVVEYLIEGGVDGLVVAGGTGEFDVLTVEERRAILETVVDHSKGRVGIVAQTGGLSTREAIELSNHADGLGVDVLMLSIPFYEPLNPKQIVDFFSAVAATSELPLMVYNYPVATGINFDQELLAALTSAVPSVRYIKDSSGDLLNAHSDSRRLHGLTMFSGTDYQAGPALLLGAPGVINGGANVFPGRFKTMSEAAKAGDPAAVTREWLELVPFLTSLSEVPFVSAIKHSMKAAGVNLDTAVRAPHQNLTAEEAEIIRALVAALLAPDGEKRELVNLAARE